MSDNLLERLELMTWAEKCEHFARKDAFRHPRQPGEDRAQRLRLPKASLPKINPSSLTIDDGNIIRLTMPVIGRPCFGIPTALLVHGHADATTGADGKLRRTRCGGCPIKDACRYVVEQRLHHTTQGVRDAYDEFSRRGGGAAVWKKNNSIGSTLLDVTRKLVAADLTSVNDEPVADHYEAVAKARLEQDRQRKQLHRQHSVGQAILPTAIRSELKAGFQLREARIAEAKISPASPHWLARTPDPAFYGLVWLSERSLSLAGRKHGATHIAAHLQKQLGRFAAHDANVLRNRVGRALKRFTDLESLMHTDGATCWPQSQT